MLQITKTNETDARYEFTVEIDEGGSKTHHGVTAEKEYIARLAGKDAQPKDLIEWSFRFLLDREPKEAILPEFDLSVIQKYFPEYEKTTQKHFTY